MARTKSSEKRKLAEVAHCMDNYLRKENDEIIKQIEYERTFHEFKVDLLKARKKELKEQINQDQVFYINLLQRRDNRIRELEAAWEDIANTLNDALEDNNKLKRKIAIMEAQLLDCSCNESQ